MYRNHLFVAPFTTENMYTNQVGVVGGIVVLGQMKSDGVRSVSPDLGWIGMVFIWAGSS